MENDTINYDDHQKYRVSYRLKPDAIPHKNLYTL